MRIHISISAADNNLESLSAADVARKIQVLTSLVNNLKKSDNYATNPSLKERVQQHLKKIAELKKTKVEPKKTPAKKAPVKKASEKKATAPKNNPKAVSTKSGEIDHKAMVAKHRDLAEKNTAANRPNAAKRHTKMADSHAELHKLKASADRAAKKAPKSSKDTAPKTNPKVVVDKSGAIDHKAMVAKHRALAEKNTAANRPNAAKRHEKMADNHEQLAGLKKAPKVAAEKKPVGKKKPYGHPDTKLTEEKAKALGRKSGKEENVLKDGYRGLRTKAPTKKADAPKNPKAEVTKSGAIDHKAMVAKHRALAEKNTAANKPNAAKRHTKMADSHEELHKLKVSTDRSSKKAAKQPSASTKKVSSKSK